VARPMWLVIARKRMHNKQQQQLFVRTVVVVMRNRVLWRLESRQSQSCGAWNHAKSSLVAPGVTPNPVLWRLESRQIVTPARERGEM
jgi:hypothetical protein